MLIRALASESKLNLLAVPIPQLIRPAVGASEKALAALFEHARAHRPCLVFLDELQALFSRRDGEVIHLYRVNPYMYMCVYMYIMCVCLPPAVPSLSR